MAAGCRSSGLRAALQPPPPPLPLPPPGPCRRPLSRSPALPVPGGHPSRPASSSSSRGAGPSPAAGPPRPDRALAAGRPARPSAAAAAAASDFSSSSSPESYSEEEEARLAHRDLNRRICAAESAEAVLSLVGPSPGVGGSGGGGLRRFNLVNAVTAFHRLAKHGQRLPPVQQRALAAHPAARALAAALEVAAAGGGGGGGAPLTDLQAAQLLWGHSQLGHGTPALLDAVYAQLAHATVRGGGNGGGGGGSGTAGGTGAAASSPSSDRGSSPADGLGGGSSGGLVVEGTATAVTLAYAMARLQRPHPQLLQRLAAALLAAEGGSDGGGGEAEHADPTLPRQQQQQEQQRQEEEEEEQQQRGKQEQQHVRRPQRPGGSREAGGGVSLADCDSRSLCLLLWSLASLRACPPALLAAGCATLRRAGLGGLSVQSMTQVLQAQDMVGRWDQPLVERISAELALRWHRSLEQQQQQQEQQQQQGSGDERRPQRAQRGQRPFHLNEMDCSILARCLALAWHQAVAASPVGAEASENRLALGKAMQRHIMASPHRRGVARLLAAASRQLAPRLAPQALSSLAHSFAAIGGCPWDLLEELAARAVQLERQLDAQAVANLAWAYSTLRYDHPQLYDSLAAAALRLLAAPPPAAGTASSRGGGGGGGGREGFTAQAVSVVVFSFASANRCHSPVQREMFLALADRALELLPQFTPQGLSNLAWGLTVAACYPPKLLRRWRALAGAASPRFKQAELNQLHLVEVALRLEAPGLGLDLPRESARFFEGLYQTGRMRAFAGSAWQLTLAAGPRSVTDFQLQVHRTVCGLGVPCVLEHSEAGEYSIDVALPEHKIAVEVDGPVHFAANSRHLMGGTALKRRLLERLGWRAVDVPYYEWWALAPARRPSYMRRKLEAAGLSLSQEQQQQQEEGQQQQQEQQKRQQRQEEEQQQERQQQQEEVAGVPGTEEQPRQEQGRVQAAAAQEPAEPAAASVAQRAQRLSMLQYRQGRLSRKSLLARGSMQASSAAATAAAAAAAAAASTAAGSAVVGAVAGGRPEPAAGGAPAAVAGTAGRGPHADGVDRYPGSTAEGCPAAESQDTDHPECT